MQTISAMPAAARARAPRAAAAAPAAGFVRLDLPNAEVGYWPGFFPASAAEAAFEALRGEIAWRRHRVRVRGREAGCPRLSSWQGDPGAVYSYSGLVLRPEPWTAAVRAVRRRVEAAAGAAFNGVLANLYRSGDDRLGWHADDEPELGPEPVVASVSFGAARRFLLRPRGAAGRASVPLILEPGSLLLMRGPTQRHWRHALPPTRRRVGPRLSLTFRRIFPGGGEAPALAPESTSARRAEGEGGERG